MKRSRTLLALLAAGAIGLGGGLVAAALSPSPAAALGAQLMPGSRQFLCWQDAQTWGPPMATNPACQSVIKQAGTDWFWNWFANFGGPAGSVPDGRICDGGGTGPFNFAPFNQARDDWPYTRVTAGATYQFRHSQHVHHPGRFDVYLTIAGWNPDTPLAWSELELVHTVTDPPLAGPDPDGLSYYFWNATLPPDRTGHHLMFIHWVRSDTPSELFNCADLRFDGGNGEVVFPDVKQTSRAG